MSTTTLSRERLRAIASSMETPTDVRSRCLSFLDEQPDSFCATGDEVQSDILLQIYERRVAAPIGTVELPTGTSRLVEELRSYRGESVWVLATDKGAYVGFFVAGDESWMIGVIVSD